MQQNEKRILTKAAVTALVGMSAMTIDRAEREGRFPKRVQTGPNSVGWLSDEIAAWIEALPRGPLPPRPGPIKHGRRGAAPATEAA